MDLTRRDFIAGASVGAASIAALAAFAGTAYAADTETGGSYGCIPDVSEHNGYIDWAAARQGVAFAILRIQDGTYADHTFAENVAGCNANGIPYWTYSFFRRGTASAAIADAELMAARMANAGAAPQGVFLDCEVEGVTAEAVYAATARLRELGAKRVGWYIANNLYGYYGLDTSKADCIWIPTYGANDGNIPTRYKPGYACDLWQYTSMGAFDGCSDDSVDLNVIDSRTSPRYDVPWYTGDGAAVIAHPSTVSDANAAVAASYGATVRGVQGWLNAGYGTGLVEDGIYGAKTKRALVMALQHELNVQTEAGLVVDGIWGSRTRAKCIRVHQGARGNISRILQGALICRGYSGSGFDGVFGAGTASAVMRYQGAHGLTRDGIAGPQTWASLLA